MKTTGTVSPCAGHTLGVGGGEGGRVTEQTESGIHPGCMMAGTTPVPVRSKNTIIQQHQSKQEILINSNSK